MGERAGGVHVPRRHDPPLGGAQPVLSSSPGRRIVFCSANPAVDRLFEAERVVRGRIHRPLRAITLPGGKGLNAARAAQTLGASATACAIVGGRSGDWIEESLEAEGIESRLIRTAAETRTCLSVADRSDGTLTEFYEDPEPIDVDVWHAFRDQVVEALDEAAFLVLSGSLPPGAPEDGYAELISAARDHDVMAAVDSRDTHLEAALEARPEIVKVNQHEARALLGETSIDDADAGLVAARSGATIAVVTLGKQGAAASLDGELVRGSVGSVGPYPVGSGDAFLGGLVTALTDGASRHEAFRVGLGASIANAHEPGAGRLDADEARRYADLALVSKVT